MAFKKTLILGASTNSSRYSYMAACRLVIKGHPIVNVGMKKGEVAEHPIEKPEIIHKDIDTLTLYVGPHNQKDLYDYIIKTKPKRIIFNPGSENPELENLAHENGIETIEACTLVMLSTNQY
ncbi:CoA-binding protein [Pedobacter psychrophilus]|uniref:CoA-binding protein n=1 Tax=Pedobacter psychrophilus TaxID=1826909 RepID=A0A179DEC1_9SPHI|nr:CoA-binding protein [Pedobacter psychrophilus]OAQ39162.1 CoA-binding protein [Pedobacter psychrophilus]